MAVPPRMNFLTIACSDVERTADFYRSLGWPEAPSSEPPHRVFQLENGVVLALYGAHHYERDYGAVTEGFRAYTLGLNVGSREEVERLHGVLAELGVPGLSDVQTAEWGCIFTFRDPEGTIWDVAYAEGSAVDERGLLTFP